MCFWVGCWNFRRVCKFFQRTLFHVIIAYFSLLPQPLHETAALLSACGTRQRALGKFSSVKGSLPSVFYRALDKDCVECLREPSAKKVAVTTILGDGCFAECLQESTQQRFFFFFWKFFAKGHFNRHSVKKLFFFEIFCRVSFTWLSATWFFCWVSYGRHLAKK